MNYRLQAKLLHLANTRNCDRQYLIKRYLLSEITAPQGDRAASKIVYLFPDVGA